MLTKTTGSSHSKPGILLLIDEWDWAFHTIARAISSHLSDRFRIEILAAQDEPFIDESQYDIIHVFYENVTYHRKFLQGKAKILKGVYNHYWERNGMSPDDFYAKYLYEADAITVPSRKLLEVLGGIPCPVHFFPEGVDTTLFHITGDSNRAHCAGYAGSNVPTKNVQMLRDACKDLMPLQTSIGRERTQQEMPDFFRSVDIFATASVSEGCPRPLLEAMACGAFPVMFDVGIAPEMIRSGYNGLIVQNQSAAGLRDALIWCKQHPEIIEHARPHNYELIRATRRWENVMPSIADIYESLLV